MTVLEWVRAEQKALMNAADLILTIEYRTERALQLRSGESTEKPRFDARTRLEPAPRIWWIHIHWGGKKPDGKKAIYSKCVPVRPNGGPQPRFDDAPQWEREAIERAERKLQPIRDALKILVDIRYAATGYGKRWKGIEDILRFEDVDGDHVASPTETVK
ncbi:MAG: hypothetical protein HQL38_03200 [Alphaproteobacteria bacterium]|nr:hypothetical protein [Alphaproteobacteria bacterium]